MFAAAFFPTTKTKNENMETTQLATGVIPRSCLVEYYTATKHELGLNRGLKGETQVAENTCTGGNPYNPLDLYVGTWLSEKGRAGHTQLLTLEPSVCGRVKG